MGEGLGLDARDAALLRVALAVLERLALPLLLLLDTQLLPRLVGVAVRVMVWILGLGFGS